jgi:PAS domain S-box-containing protein
MISLLAMLSYKHSINEAEYLARHEAKSIAKTISFDLIPYVQSSPTLNTENRSDLQKRILHFTNEQKRDIVVVDTSQNIIADAVPDEIGTVFEHDINDEVGQTIKDGTIRTFAEISNAYPQGIMSIAVPLDTVGGLRLGAIILEYTPLYNEIIGEVKKHTKRFLKYFVIALIFASAVGYIISLNISAPLKEIENAAMQFAKGDMETKVTYKSNDELGILAKSFNTMVSDINIARDKLMNANKELEQEIEERKKAENELGLFSAAVDDAMDGIQIVDLDGYIIYSNRAVEEIYGYTSGELKGMHVNDMNVDSEFAVRVILPSIRLSERWDGEIVVKRKGGGEFPIWLSTSLVKGADGMPIAMVGTIRDMTERRKVQEMLTESEKRFRAAFENAGVGASMVNLEGRFIKVNRFLCDMLGYSEEELLSKTFSEITHPDDVQIGMDAAKRLVSGEADHASFEKRYIRKDGRLINVIISPAIIRDSDGNPLHFVSLFQDITERKRAEKELYESREFFKDIVELTNAIHWEFDLKANKFTYVSPKAEDILGFPPDAWTDFDFWASRIHPDDREWVIDYCRQQTEKLLGHEFVYRMISNEGKTVWLKDIVHVISDNRKPIILNGIMFDVSRLKEAEEQVKTSLKEKEVLLQEVHHRVKNNMQVISSLLKLQAEYIKDEKTVKQFLESQNRIRSMALIHEKLYMSENLASVDFKNYVQALTKSLRGSFGKLRFH